MTADTAAVAWTANDGTFPARLALVRQRKGWGNVKEAALACGVPVESWRNWERDNRKPRDYENVCRQIAQASGCDLGWLMGVDVPQGAGITHKYSHQSSSRTFGRLAQLVAA